MMVGGSLVDVAIEQGVLGEVESVVVALLVLLQEVCLLLFA